MTAIATTWTIEALASYSQLRSMQCSGFFERLDQDEIRHSGLHSWLLSNCQSTFFYEYLRGGLQHWSRLLEYPYILVQIAQFASTQQEAKDPQLRVFDNACGVNATAYLLAKFGFDLQGTDLNDQPSEEGVLPSGAWSHPDTSQLVGKMQFQPADSLNLPFADGHFDVSYSISSLEHMPDPVQAVREMVRVTRPGGLITFTMDVAPYQAALGGESNVNCSNFTTIQQILHAQCTPQAPARWPVPGTELCWANDCRRSSALRRGASRFVRKLNRQPPEANFYVFAGCWIKR